MTRAWKTAALAALAIVGATFAWRGFERWSDGNALATARRDLTRGRPGSARERLVPLAAKRPGDPATEYLLGLAEEAAGSPDAALAAFLRVPSGSAEFPDAVAKIAGRSIETGRFAEAERALVEGLKAPGGRAVEMRQLMLRLYWHEGRLDEVARLAEANFLAIAERDGSTSPEALAILRSRLSVDLEHYPIDSFKTILAEFAAKAPDDDRLKLARAAMATRSGLTEEASAWIDACLKLRPDDPAVLRLEIERATAAGDLAGVERAAGVLRAADVPPAFARRVAAWIARRRNDPKRETDALNALLDLDPGDSVALTRLAELAEADGRSAEALALRRRKAEIDADKRTYRGLIQSEYVKTADEMAKLAERLGRSFEAFAFRAIATGRKPSSLADDPNLARYRRVSAEPASGGSLADAIGLDRSGSGASIRRSVDRPTVPAFEDLASIAGLDFVYRNGRSELRQLPETMSGGLALIDYDNDGRLDVYAVQGGDFPPDPDRPHAGDRLFRNLGGNRFEDVTERAKLGGGRGYSLGAAVGDFDGDGRPDLLTTRWRSCSLHRNKGDGTFEDVTEKAGLGVVKGWPTSAAFGDLDGDGDLDLYLCQYLDWDEKNPRPCFAGAGVRSYCDPRLLAALPDQVFRNDGGRFVDATKEAGFVDLDGRGLGVVINDFDGDGRVDVFVANDGTANLLFRNKGGFRFEEVGLASGVAGNAEGGFQAGMGVACGDVDGDGTPDLIVTNFYGESSTFYQNLGEGRFSDRTASVGLGALTRTLLGFGVALADFDDDGRLDLASTNGHVNDLRPTFPYSMRSQLLLGGRDGRFRDVSSEAGPAWDVPHVGRGLVRGDMDDDGRMDLLMLPQEEPLVYLHNGGTPGARRHRLTIKLEGTKSNRDGVGARVAVKAGGRTQVAWRFGGGSYQSSGDPRLHFGLGDATAVDEVEIRWPSGIVDVHRGLKIDALHSLKEGAAAVRSPTTK